VPVLYSFSLPSSLLSHLFRVSRQNSLCPSFLDPCLPATCEGEAGRASLSHPPPCGAPSPAGPCRLMSKGQLRKHKIKPAPPTHSKVPRPSRLCGWQEQTPMGPHLFPPQYTLFFFQQVFSRPHPAPGDRRAARQAPDCSLLPP
jgi:hypothetical protein